MDQELAIQALKAYNTTWEILNEIRILMKSKKGEWKLLGSKKKEMIERKFRVALDSTKNIIESCIWYGKGFAISANCGIKIDKEFHDLMGLTIMKFNDISIRLDAEKLDEKLVENFESQFKILTDYAQHFWNMNGLSNNPNKEADALKIIEDFRSRLWDFTRIMEPYLKSEEAKTVTFR